MKTPLISSKPCKLSPALLNNTVKTVNRVRGFHSFHFSTLSRRTVITAATRLAPYFIPYLPQYFILQDALTTLSRPLYSARRNQISYGKHKILELGRHIRPPSAVRVLYSTPDATTPVIVLYLLVTAKKRPWSDTKHAEILRGSVTRSDYEHLNPSSNFENGYIHSISLWAGVTPVYRNH